RALRFRVPEGGATAVHDLIRGEVVVENAKVEDFVLLKSSGAPLFLLANVVDDADMAMTHVIRGEDHLTNTTKYLLLWQALRAGPVPVFAHLPLLVNERRQKLSKRRDPVALESYREQGYLPDAVVNYLALLGWGPEGDQEILSRDELVAQFRLEDVNHSPAFFDVAKLTHFNGVHIRAMTTEAFVGAARPFLEAGPWPPERYDAEAFSRLAPLVKERVSVLSEVPGMVDFVFLPEPEVDPDSWGRVMAGDAEGAEDILRRAFDAYAGCPWEAAALHDVTQAVGQAVGRGLGKAQAPIRVAVTGRRVGPPLFESLEVLGRDVVRERLAAALARLANARPQPAPQPAPAHPQPAPQPAPAQPEPGGD
ncbi:MAG: glutamate--tRNA ligase, partial [Acidimicrobiales bacterium]